MEDGLDLRERIRRNYAQLRRSEQLVADYLNQIAGQRLDLSITDLARLIGVSEATVSRVSKALGFSGYPNMKLSIAAASHQGGEYANIPSELISTDEIAEIGPKLSSAFTAGIHETERDLDYAQVKKAVDQLVAARRVVFMGVGGAAAICQEAAHVFLKIGVDATSYNDGYTQTIVASTLGPDSLLIALSHTGSTPTVISAVKLARENGAKTIAITSHAQSALAQAAELAFATASRAGRAIPLHGDFLEGRICQLYLIDLLYIGTMFRLDAEARRHLARTTQALVDHYGIHTAFPAAPGETEKP